tara:strand:+ start:202 stop:693 length:492 start_codon:yes stop_codon:yes gene_type:complete
MLSILIKIMLIFLLPITALSQEIIRENIGSLGSVNKIDNIHFRQSIGQSSSATGVFNKNGIILRQGFQQPFLLIKKINLLQKNELDVLVFPNPFKSEINVKLIELPIGTVQLIIYDVNGKVVKQIDYKAKRDIIIPLQNLTNGNYILNINNSNKNYNATLIKN